jgi:hypothetical protein
VDEIVIFQAQFSALVFDPNFAPFLARICLLSGRVYYRFVDMVFSKSINSVIVFLIIFLFIARLSIVVSVVRSFLSSCALPTDEEISGPFAALVHRVTTPKATGQWISFHGKQQFGCRKLSNLVSMAQLVDRALQSLFCSNY